LGKPRIHGDITDRGFGHLNDVYGAADGMNCICGGEKTAAREKLTARLPCRRTARSKEERQVNHRLSPRELYFRTALIGIVFRHLVL
jgi:hypothetical protein